MEKDFTCEWGTEFKAGNVVVVGKYYQNWGSSESSYVFLLTSPTVFLHVAHVRAIKFPVLPCDHRVQGNDLAYTLPDYSLVVFSKQLLYLDFDSD